MKKIALLSVLAGLYLLVSCAPPHKVCPTYSNSGLKWNKKNSHPYGNHR